MKEKNIAYLLAAYKLKSALNVRKQKIKSAKNATRGCRLLTFDKKYHIIVPPNRKRLRTLKKVTLEENYVYQHTGGR